MNKVEKFRYFCYTWNNYTEANYEQMKEMECLYHVCGKEVGESGTPHLQGYVELKEQIRLPTLVKRYKGIHVEARKGTAEQAANYCLKGKGTPDEPVEFDGFVNGKMQVKKQGERTDLKKLREKIRENPKIEMHEMDIETYAKYKWLIDDLKNKYMPKRDTETPLMWFWGTTLTHKSHIASDIGKAMGGSYVKPKGKWWDGYENEPVVIIQDYRADAGFYFDDLLRLGDQDALKVPVKGGFKEFNSKLVIITCPMNPEKCFEGILKDEDSIDQLMRRIVVCSNNTPYYDEEGKEVERPVDKFNYDKRAEIKDIKAEADNYEKIKRNTMAGRVVLDLAKGKV